MHQKLTLRKGLTIASFLLPSFVGFVAFVLAPMVMAVVLSFTNYSGGPVYRFVGVKNYIIAFSSSKFLSYLGITFNYMIVSVFFQITLGLGFSLLLAKTFRGCALFRSVYYIPNILSSVSVGLAFMFLFEPNSGLINQVMISMGMTPLKWLASESTALSVIITVTVWQNFGYYMVLFIGGLQNINSSLYEAASMDGANAWQRFISVTIPGLSPILFYAITIAVIRGFQVFDYIFIMTGGQQGGGPAGSTIVLAFDIYRNAFTHFRFGYASAESVVLMVIILIITFVQQHGQKKWVNYDVV